MTIPEINLRSTLSSQRGGTGRITNELFTVPACHLEREYMQTSVLLKNSQPQDQYKDLVELANRIYAES